MKVKEESEKTGLEIDIQKTKMMASDPISSQFSRSTCPGLCNPMNCSMPGLPVHHQLPEFTQTHVHRVSDANQPPHPLSSPFLAFNFFHHQGLFPYGSAGKETACNVGDLGSIPGLGRSPGEGKGYPLQYSGLENSMNKELDMTEQLTHTHT